MTSKEISHSPELLFSCYHFPRQHSCHRSVFELTVCLYKWVTLGYVRKNSEHKMKTGEELYVSIRRCEELSNSVQNIVHLKEAIKIFCLFTGPVKRDEQLTYVQHGLVCKHMTSSYVVEITARLRWISHIPLGFQDGDISHVWRTCLRRFELTWEESTVELTRGEMSMVLS